MEATSGTPSPTREFDTSANKTIITYYRRSKTSKLPSVTSHVMRRRSKAPLWTEKKEQQQKQHVLSPCMQRKRIKRNRKTELPEDLIHKEILTRLPATYLVRFRSVCKSWKSLISNSEFVKSHLNRLLSYSYKDEDLVIVKKDTTDHGIFIVSYSNEIHVHAVSRFCDKLLGSIHGLVCMASEDGKDFCLWNPATAQLVEIHLPLQHSKNRTHLLGGFAWDHLRNDYKVVVLSHEISNRSSRKICVYSSNSASWTEVDILDHSTYGSMPFMAPSTIVKGIPYWMSTDYLRLRGQKHKARVFHVYKFVAEINKFRSLPLLDLDETRYKSFHIVNIKNCVIGMASSYENNSVDIYSLDEESPSCTWSKMYTMEPVILRSCIPAQCLRHDGETLIASYVVPLSVIDHKIKETTELAEFHRCDCPRVRMSFGYTPSLVCVQGMKPMLEFLRCKKSNRLNLKMSSPFCNWVSYSDC